ncbi:hypothetical protein [Streptomyces sp. SM8]|uniref:hypothetical protein n=1 Tax=Streptomyces sp. SM8 TaxID=1195457 RepID=UPI0002831139|nr:hypothetical protein [Streptomyces sp. SM8]PKA37946.1 hypothetical protein SM8_029450 [Streptomyces sp. SM8]
MTTKTPAAVRLARKYGQSAVLYAALALSAPGEYKLAVMAGWNPNVAWLMPAVMSLYAAISASVAKAQTERAHRLRGTSKEAEARGRSRRASAGALLALLMATAAQVVEHVLQSDATGATLWTIVVVSAVPPLVAAHVLHVDPPEDDDEDEVVPAPAVILPLPPAVKPEPTPEEKAEEEPERAEEEPVDEEKPILVTYREAADAIGVAPETVRGAANDGRLKKYDGPTPSSRLVDLRVARTVIRPRRTVGV